LPVLLDGRRERPGGQQQQNGAHPGHRANKWSDHAPHAVTDRRKNLPVQTDTVKRRTDAGSSARYRQEHGDRQT
jgi:hypothetical protein